MSAILLVGIFFSIIHSIHGKLWNLSDPLPPLQPKEVGLQTLNRQDYYIVGNGKKLFDITVSGYQFESYENQIVIAYATGQNSNTNPTSPLMQYAYNNYLTKQNMLASYTTQTCTYGSVEGYSPYPGYDFYTSYILYLYSQNAPITFDYITLPEYGTCLKYTAPVPWNNNQLPRNMTYTLIYQQSTGYLIEYNLIGTEYCCLEGYCPNEGLCNDGSEPFLTYAMTNQTLYGYQIFNSTSWPQNFFQPYCPFPSTTSLSSSSKKLSIGDALAILFGLLLALAFSSIVALYYQIKSLRTLSLQANNDRKSIALAQMNNA